MNPSRDWPRIRSAFELAVDLPPAALDSWLDESVGRDTADRAEVERLLALDSGTNRFLAPPAASRIDGIVRPELGIVGERVGAYRLVKLLAAGGMGVVYEAEQEVPKRRVALKMIRPAHASPLALERFRDEIEHLARLRHPGIAQVHEVGVAADGGSTAGIPWFTMELVEDALPITEHAHSRGLDVRARLALAQEACEAVHHGHQRGVIHRDLKPSNVLVDASGRVKVIDFGIARATADSDSEAIARTREGELLGTLLYMSPEQLQGRHRDLDLRVDVYALGVLLYELLCGRPPFALEDRSVPEAIRILDQDPPSLTAAMSGGSRELAWIVHKAMAREREARYDSALDLARDLQRFLNDEPVLAGPESRAYRMQKFVRRHRVAVAGAAAVALATVLGLAGISLALLRAIRAESDANVERASALGHAARAETVVDFLLDLFSAVDPANQGRDVKMADALDRAARDFERRFADQPAIRSWVGRSIGIAYQGLGLAEEAQRHVRAALETARSQFGETHPETVRMRMELASVLARQGLVDEADALLDGALAALDAGGAPDDRVARPVGAESAASRLRLLVYRSAVLGARDRKPEARDLLQDVVPRMEAALGADHRDTLMAVNALAGMHHELGDLAAALPLYRRALEGLRARKGADHPDTLSAMNNTAMALYFLGQREEAVPLLEQVLAARRRLLGPSHPDTVTTLNNLGGIHFVARRYDDAARCYDECLQALAGSLPSHHPVLLTVKLNLGTAEGLLGNHARAAELTGAVYEERRTQLGPGHEKTLNALSAYADSMRLQGRVDDSVRAFEEGCALAREHQDRAHPAAYSLQIGLGRALRDSRRFEDAERVLRECTRTYPDVVKQSTIKYDLPTPDQELADLQAAWGRRDEAKEPAAAAAPSSDPSH